MLISVITNAAELPTSVSDWGPWTAPLYVMELRFSNISVFQDGKYDSKPPGMCGSERRDELF